MAGSDRDSYNVNCPQCGQIGVLHVSEDDHPYMRNPHRNVDRIDGNFSATVQQGVEVIAFCKACNRSLIHL